MMTPVKSKFKVGDRVFAKVKGHPYWPEIIDSVDLSTNISKYCVTFYGSQKIGENVKENDICLFSENKARFCQQYTKNKNFRLL
jgi:hypothetical protein